jgi:hypothetical protein
LVCKHHQAAKQMHDHKHDPDFLLSALDNLVIIRVSCDFNIYRSYKD